jgi:hypothetical protein
MLTRQSWTITMIVQLWMEFFDLLDQRNSLVHGNNDKNTREGAKRQRAITKIKHLHTKQ